MFLYNLDTQNNEQYKFKNTILIIVLLSFSYFALEKKNGLPKG